LLAEVYLELIGGRQTALVLDTQVRRKTVEFTFSGPVNLARPSPLPSRITAEEREAHQLFVKQLGEHALWKLAGDQA
jgi:DNA polymerase III subunit epsilon